MVSVDRLASVGLSLHDSSRTWMGKGRHFVNCVRIRRSAPPRLAKWRWAVFSGSRVVLHYTVGDVEVRVAGQRRATETIVTRTLEIGPARSPLTLVCGKGDGLNSDRRGGVRMLS
jgi:hypothetical protein